MRLPDPIRTHAVRGPILLGFILCAAAADAAEIAWPRYGMDDGGTRHVRGASITPANVARLDVAWSYRSGDLGDGARAQKKLAHEATPILFADRLYFSTPFNVIVALDAASGQEVWRFDAKPDPQVNYSEVVSRGVALWGTGAQGAGGACAARVLAGTIDGRLLALDARDGSPCADFGAGGTVDLARDVQPRQPASTRPPRHR
jgi:quinoprotein glucose dehydrogenase